MVHDEGASRHPASPAQTIRHRGRDKGCGPSHTGGNPSQTHDSGAHQARARHPQAHARRQTAEGGLGRAQEAGTGT